MLGLGLLVGSLPGPWLTLVLPTGIALVVQDRRAVARAAGAGVAAASVALALAMPGGAVLIGAAAASSLAVALLPRTGPLGLDRAALPALLAAGGALGAGVLLAPEAVAAWETGLAEAVEAAGAAAVERYRGMGLDPASVTALEDWAAAATRWTVTLWPALVALPFWLGAWWGHRLVARAGRPRSRVLGRLAREPFERFALDDRVLWLTIAALAAAWLPGPARRVALNGLALAAALHAIQGAALVGWWLARRGIGTGWRLAIGAALALLAPPLTAAGALAVGLAGHWIDPRRHGVDAGEDEV